MNNACNPIKYHQTKPYVILALDQRKLPHETIWIELSKPQDYIDAIRDMVVRGAPLIGFTAIYACANWISQNIHSTKAEFRQFTIELKAARPTAINLAYEVDRIVNLFNKYFSDFAMLAQMVWKHAESEIELLTSKNSKMAKFVIDDLKGYYPNQTFSMLTICNTGRLACGTIGTALGVVEQLSNEKLLNCVYACETRPYLQGSRLTAYELTSMKIDFYLIVEGAIRQLMKTNKIHAVVAGADRIASNGDTANKVGTSVLAEIAKSFSIPFYIVAPLSSFDISLNSGDEIPIEYRNDKEITEIFGRPISPFGSKTFNPSFDVTPSSLISGGIACEFGLIKNNFTERIKDAFNRG